MLKVNSYFYILLYILAIITLLLLSFFKIIPKDFIFFAIFLEFIWIIKDAIEDLSKKQISTELFLITASIVSLIGKEYNTIAIILIIMIIAKFLNLIIENKTENAIDSLIKLMPDKATVLLNNKEISLSINKIKKNMTVIVKSGQKIPIDGIIQKGKAEINESSLTGENNLKFKTINDLVYAGTFVETGDIVIKTEKVAEETLFAKIKRKIEEAQKSKSKYSTISNKIANILTPVIIISLIIIWVLTKNLKLIITLLVFGSPLELALITPLAILSSTAAAFKNGILIKGGIYIEELSKIDTIVFDKTGTITENIPSIDRIESLNKEYDKKDILKLAAIAEKVVTHPIGISILNEAKKNKLNIPEPEDYKIIIGSGIEFKYLNKNYTLGSNNFLNIDKINNLNEKLYTIIYLKENSQIIGKIYLLNKIRKEAYDTIKILKNYNIKNFYILSGDSQEATDFIAKKLSIKNAYGNMLPDQKINKIIELQNKNLKVAMIGDGINDAPAIKQANVGIAMGALDIQPTIEAADIIFLNNDLKKLVFIYRLSQKTMRIIKQNLFIGFLLVHTIGITMAFLNIISPVQAAFFHAIPDFLILINSIRLINFREN